MSTSRAQRLRLGDEMGQAHQERQFIPTKELIEKIYREEVGRLSNRTPR